MLNNTHAVYIYIYIYVVVKALTNVTIVKHFSFLTLVNAGSSIIIITGFIK